MDIIESIPCNDVGGFHITLDALVEHIPLEDTFDDSATDLQQLADDINSGKYLYFCARVSAYKDGVLLAQDYLGACLYESLEDFKKGGYFEDMVDNCISEAKATLEKLVA